VEGEEREEQGKAGKVFASVNIKSWVGLLGYDLP